MLQKRTWKLLTLPVIMSMVLSAGCANNPELRDSERMTADNLEETVKKREKELNDVWSKNDPAVTYTEREGSIFVQRMYAIPEDIANKKIRLLTIKPGSTLRDLSGVLYPYKVNIVFPDDAGAENKSLPVSAAASNLADKQFSIKNYSGTLGELLSLIESLHDISFEYVGSGTLKGSTSTRYIASFPQVASVLTSISENFSSIGAKNVKTNILAGSVVYEANRESQNDIVKFVERFYENYAGVKLQLTVFSVSLDETLSDGFDWSSLNLVMGNVEAAHAGGYIDKLLDSLAGNTTGTGSGTGTGTGTTPGTGTGTGTGTGNNNNNSNGSTPNFGYNSRYAGSSIDDMRAFSWMKDGSMELGAFNKNLSASIALNWMNQYGNTKAEQSAFIETITGKETVIGSQRRIPVIGSQSTTLVGNLTPVAQQSTQLEEETVGMKIKFTPYFDASSQEMIVELDVSMKSIVGKQTIPQADGSSFEKPEVQEEAFPTTVRMKVGETKLLGGVVYSNLIESRSNLSLFKMSDEYIKQNLQKSAMFIMIRPSVQLFKQPGDLSAGDAKPSPEKPSVIGDDGSFTPLPASVDTAPPASKASEPSVEVIPAELKAEFEEEPINE